MAEQTPYARQLASRAVITAGVAYTLTFGGTYNGVLIGRLQIVSLILLTAGIVIWGIFIWRIPLRNRLKTSPPGPLSASGEGGSGGQPIPSPSTERGLRGEVNLLKWPLNRPLTPLDPALILWGFAYMVSSLPNLSGRVAIGLWYAGLYTGAWLVFCDLRRRGLPGRWLTDAALLASIPVIIVALAQVADWFPAWIVVRQKGISVAFVPPRPPGVFGNPNILGAVLAMLLPLGWARVCWSARRLDRRLWATWLILALAALYLTSSRGAWLAAGSAFVVQGGLTLYHNGRVNPAIWWQHQSRYTRLGIVTAGLTAGLALLFVSQSLFDTPRRSNAARLTFYEIAGETFTSHPGTGTGPFTFGLVLLENRSVPPEQPHAHAHNLILNVAAEMGLPGLIALGVTALLIVRHGLRALRTISDPAEWAQTAACGAALAAVGAHSLVDMPMSVPAVMLLMLAILAAGMVLPSNAGAGLKPVSTGYLRDRMLHFFPLGLWAVVLATGWWSALIYADYIRGEQSVFEGDYRQGAEILRGVADRQPFIALYHAEYAYACGLLAATGDESRLSAGIAAYERALDMEAPHADWWTNLAALYWQAGQRDQAIEAMRRAVSYAPDDPDLWLNLGLYYERQGIDDQAEDAYCRVLEVNPLWGHAAFWSETRLRRIVLDKNPVEDTPYRRARTLWSGGERGAALGVFDDEIAHDPTQPAPYVDMARLYLAAGDLDRARDYRDTARLLVHNDVDQARLFVLEAELALAEGDRALAGSRLDQASALLLPDDTGRPLYLYGRQIAHFQFLRITVRGKLLPQVVMLGPAPTLVDWLEEIYASWSGD